MSDLLARHAECLFWYGRYAERTACLARILEVQASFSQGSCNTSDWSWLLRLYDDQERFANSYDVFDARNVIRFYVMDRENPGSIKSCLRAARENARALRSQMPVGFWQQINTFYNQFRALTDREISEARLSRTCELVEKECYAQLGVAESTVYRDEGWCFLQLGIMVERADQMSRLLDVRFAQLRAGSGLVAGTGQPAQLGDFGLWAVLLRAVAGHHAFLRAVSGKRDPEHVARFLIFDRCLPRSIACCVNEIDTMLNTLRSGFGLRTAQAPLERVDTLRSALDTAARDPKLVETLHTFNDAIQRHLIALTSELAGVFFNTMPHEVSSATTATVDLHVTDSDRAESQFQKQSVSFTDSK